MLMGGDGPKLGPGSGYFELHSAGRVIGANNLAGPLDSLAGGAYLSAAKKTRQVLDWIERGGESDANRTSAGKFSYVPLQPLQRKSQMRSALVPSQRVKFIDDNVLDGRQLLPKTNG